MFSPPETRIWAGRVGGNPAWQRNATYRMDAGLGGILQRIRFQALLEPVQEPYIASEVMTAAYLGAGVGGVVVGSVSDGSTWPPYGPPIFNFNTPRDGLWIPGYADGGHLVVVTTSGVWVSMDRGVTWSNTLPAPAGAWRCVAYSPELGRLVAGGENRAQAYSDDGGMSWTYLGAPGSAPFTRAAWGGVGPGFIFATEGGASSVPYRTGDGQAVAVQVASTFMVGAVNPVVVWSDALGLFVMSASTGEVGVSPNGTTWYNVGSPFPGGATPKITNILVHPDGLLFLAAGTQDMYWTADPDFAVWSVYTYAGPEPARYGVWTGDKWLLMGWDTDGDTEIYETPNLSSWELFATQTFQSSVMVLIPDVTGLWAYPPAPRINVILESRRRPASSMVFPLSVFSPGGQRSILPPSSAYQGSPLIVDRALELHWWLEPGDVVRVEPEYPSRDGVEFVASILQEPGEVG